MAAVAAQVGPSHVELAVVCDGDDEGVADGVDADVRGPFCDDHEVVDGLVCDEAAHNVVEST